MFFAAQNSFVAESINMQNALKKEKPSVNNSKMTKNQSFHKSEKSSDR